MSSDELRTAMEDATPLKRLGHVDDIAAAILYLVSPAGAYVTGKILEVDGGLQSPNLEFAAPRPLSRRQRSPSCRTASCSGAPATSGRHALAGIDAHPDLELVGVFVSNPDKVGQRRRRAGRARAAPSA